MPRKRTRGRVAAGVARRQGRDGDCYLRFRAVVYEDQVAGVAKPSRRVIAASREVYRKATHPQDWEASVREAREVRARIEAELLAELRAEREAAAAPVTFGELADAYERDAKIRGTRWDKERSRWAVLVAELGRDTPAESITADHLNDWRQILMARRGLQGRSVNAYVTLLRAIFRLALRNGVVQADPTALLKPYRESRGEVEFLTEAQLDAVLTAAGALQARWAGAERYQKGMRQTPIYDLVTVAYETAARTGNVLGLRWEDHVDWEAQAVVWQPGEVKNRRRVVVPLTKRLKDVLLSRWPGPGASGWVFPSSEGLEQHISNQAFRIAWKDAIALANESLGATERIPATFRVYNLRHTRATLLLKSTGDPVIVAELLGDTVKMVLDRYAGRDATNLREALAKLDAVPTAVPKRYPIERDSAPQDPTGGEPN